MLEGSRLIRNWFFAMALVLLSAAVGCASKVLEYDQAKTKELETNDEYDKKMKIKAIEPSSATSPALDSNVAATSAKPDAAPAKPAATKTDAAKHQATKAGGKKAAKKPAPSAKGKSEAKMKDDRHLPESEDAEGFIGRRPVVDPFRPGEKVTLALSYFNMTAGYLDMQVLPMVEVNGEKSYAFQLQARSNSIFSRFYAVDDKANTYLNYESMLPYNFEISVKESKQIADIRSFFDWKTLKGKYWEKRVTKDKGERSKNIEWDIKPYSQNVISAIFYLRTFTMTPGKKLSFQVADEGKNILFSAEVLRKEVLSTDIGDLNTVVIKPQFAVDGVFKPVGDILVWMTDDERKFVVRIESKIKIGTIVGKVKSIEK